MHVLNVVAGRGFNKRRGRTAGLVQSRRENTGACVLSSFHERHVTAAPRHCRRAHGFTLVELMVTIAVAAVLLVIAVPSFRTITINNRLRTAADDVYSSVSTARMEAIKRNGSTQLCGNVAADNGSDALGLKCGTSAGAVVAMAGAGASLVRAALPGLSSPLQLSGDMKALRFDSNGIAHAVGTTANYTGTIADICSDTTTTDNHRVVSMEAGSILSVSTTSGACP